MHLLLQDMAYLAFALGLTTFAAWRLLQTGRRLMLEKFRMNSELAIAVNHAAAAGFCFLMLGFVAMTARFFPPQPNVSYSLNFDLAHFGSLLLFLGFAVFLYLFVLGRIPARGRCRPHHGESPLA